MSSDPAVPQPLTGERRRTSPESLRARTLSASFSVNDLQKSLAWYRDVVGFTVDEEYRRDEELVAVALKAGSIRFLINQDDGSHGHDRVKGVGFSMFITTAQNIDEIAAQIKARGGTLDSEPADMWGMRAFRLRDPDGFRFTISSERA